MAAPPSEKRRLKGQVEILQSERCELKQEVAALRDELAAAETRARKAECDFHHGEDMWAKDVQVLTARAAEAEKGEADAHAVIDNIDRQVSDALRRLGKFPGAPAGMCDRVDAMVAIAETAVSRVERLEGACRAMVSRGHHDTCQWLLAGYPCNCGFVDALDAIAETEHKP